MMKFIINEYGRLSIVEGGRSFRQTIRKNATPSDKAKKRKHKIAKASRRRNRF